MMAFQIAPDVLLAASEHARAAFPHEACGLAVGGAYWRCENEAPSPTEHFKIADEVVAAAEATGKLDAVIHSHPNGLACPSAADMTGQAAMDLPWVILPCDLDSLTGTVEVHDPVVFGDCLGMAPSIGRGFVHGWHDCMATIRDACRKGRETLAGEGIDWPHAAIEFADCPRDVDWWKAEGQDLYLQNFAAWGFREIKTPEVRPGDVFLIALPGSHNPEKRLNHGGVLLPGNLILHHLPGRLSRREPAGNWLRSIDMWLRHEASPDA